MKTTLSTLCVLVFASICLGQKPQPSNFETAVAVVAGEPISEQELLESLGPQLRQLRNQEYQLKSKTLEGLIRRKVVEAEARKRGVSAVMLLEQEVDSKIAEPGEAEIEAYFLGQNRAGASLEEEREGIRATLKRTGILKARQVYADSLRAKSEVAVMLPVPRVAVAYDPQRVRGNPQAAVTIVEFADFQCPFCRGAEKTLTELLAKYAGQLKLAFLDFPLPEIHPQAEQAAEAARCAGEQGKFWEYHDSLFEHQSKLDEPSLLRRARDLKLDENAFQSCFESGKFRPYIEADRREGTNASIAGTPGFFINGVFLDGAQQRAEFERIITEALAVH